MAIPVVSVADIVVTESAGYAEFQFRLDAPQSEPVTVGYFTENLWSAGWLGAERDYLAVASETLTFAPGETEKSARVVLVDDDRPEAAESFGLHLSPRGSNVKVGTPVVVATILDNDTSHTGVPTVAITDPVVDEKAGRACFTVTLARPSTSAVSLTYQTADGTASAGADYQKLDPQALLFAPGERAKTVAVKLIDDATPEPGESFDLVLSAVSGASLPDARGRAFIGPSDQPTSATPVVSVADALANESTGYADFVFRLDAPQGEPVSVQYAAIGGSAKGYQNKDNDFASFGYDTLTFAPGETVKTARVGLFDDGTPETAESFHLALVELYGDNVRIGTGLATATILDDQSSLTGLPSVSIADEVIDEKAGLAYFTVVLDRPRSSVVTVTYQTADGTAISGADYEGLAQQTLAFAPGERAKTVAVNLIDDGTREATEYFDLVLLGVSGASMPDTRGRAYIGPSDQPLSASPVVSVADIFANESDGFAEFVFRLDAPAAGPTSLHYATRDGSATHYNQNDYAYVNVEKTLTFAPGEMVKTARVALVDDTTSEGPENFYLDIFNGAGLRIGTSRATATIVDNDGSSHVSYGGPADALIAGKPITEMATFAKAAYYLTSDEPKGSLLNNLNQSLSESNDYDSRAALHSVDGKWHPLDVSDLNATQLGLLHLRPGETVIRDQYWHDPLIGSSKFDPSAFNYGLREGIFTNGNAAALVARCDDALVIAFRGTNDNRGVSLTPDQKDWLYKGNHYDLLKPLIAAVDKYVADAANGITKVYVTGHSLGASMVQLYMRDPTHNDGAGLHYQAVTFANPGLSAGPLDLPDPRITNFVIEHDMIRYAEGIGITQGDMNILDLRIAFPEWVHDDGKEQHSMTLYREVASFLEKEGVNLQDLDRRLDVLDYNKIILPVKVDDRGADFDATGTRFVFSAGVGDNSLVGTAKDEILVGGAGNDWLDGGDGTDTASFAEPKSAYDVLSFGGEISVGRIGGGGDGLDTLLNVEWLNFAGEKVPATATHSPLEYIASYPDLMGAFGANPSAGYNHFIVAGDVEGRTVTFDGLQYIASYVDLMNAFGANADAGASHYIQSGRFEGRSTIFHGLQYIASYSDLIHAFGVNADAGASHYIQAGRVEGRTTIFDGLEYIASYGDLIKAFGINADAGASHFIAAGHAEGRHTGFNGLEYIASYGDLIKAFHNQVAASAHPEDIGATHYIGNGYAEHRAPDLFNAAQYLANYGDLRAAFGSDTEAATVHFIISGYFEGRTDHAPI